MRYKKSKAIKDLEQLAFEAKRLEFPMIPVEWLAAHKFSDKTANDLTKAIIYYINLRGGFAERINTMGRRIDNRKTFTDVLGRQRTIGSEKWIPTTGTRGSADISATINGRSIKIEVKTGADRQGEYQKKYQEATEQSGGVYLIARTFDEFKQQIDEIF